MEAIKINNVGFPPNWNIPSTFTDARDLFVGYLMLDAWIGNSDRHHENWGFVNSQKAPDQKYLAPTYDHASCLGRELSDEKRKSRSVEAYVKRCLSAFYQHKTDKKPLKTLDLLQYLMTQYPQASQEWLNRLEQITEKQIDWILQAFPEHRLSAVAGQFAKQILLTNQNRLLSL